MPFYDIAVIGGGHAGIEAASIASRFGIRTALITLSKGKTGYPSCNPSIGGIAKSHLVYELDVFGSAMPAAADASSVHSKLLNSSKGPAVWSLREQIDSEAYPREVLKMLSSSLTLDIIEDEVSEIVSENGAVNGIICEKSGLIKVTAAIMATGTFLNGMIFIGRDSFPAGRFSEMPSVRLPESLKKLKVNMMRLKTGTPARAYRDSVDFSKLEEQRGEDGTGAFCVLSKDKPKNTESCFIGRTNAKTHEIIKENLKYSALYSGLITGTGPKYCPSIEDKVVRFSERDSHTVFVEPMGRQSEIVYINGTSSSLPEEIQYEFLRTIPGLESVRFSQPGYAIEYDALKSGQINSAMECVGIKNLFFAGQINGTSGYEEAAAQGFVAGLNAAMAVLKRERMIFDRYTSYVGVLTDDISKKEITEPYRLFTSRSENRLFLRQDNAFIRMADYAKKTGITNTAMEEHGRMLEEYRYLASDIFDLSGALKQRHSHLNDPSRLYEDFRKLYPANSDRVVLALYSEIKYAGYIERYKKVTGRILDSGDELLKDKERLISSPIISKEAKEVLRRDDVLKLRDLFGRIDPSDVESVLLVIKRRI